VTSVYATPVPFEIPNKDFDVLFVGEAPGGEELGQGRPFVGKAGQLLRRYIQRKDCGIGTAGFANLSKYRPKGNKFSLLVGSDELERGLEDLAQTIKDTSPNVIVALGGWPLYYLTGECGRKNNKPVPGLGISSYRGSILPAKEQFQNTKVIATYHPAYIERPAGWGSNHVFFRDLCRVAEDSKFPDLRYTSYEEYIDPSSDVLEALQSEYLQAEWIAEDIETFPGGQFSCVGWAWKRPSGMMAGVCVTYKRMDLWPFAKRVWESDVPKVLQYGTYDGPFMEKFYGWKFGGFYDGLGWDTHIAAANLMPNEPRGLDFLNSIHTRFAYYKDERKVWKEEGDMNILWKYNIKDTVSTYEIALEDVQSGIGSQRGLIGRLYG
jgi:uracil-DNA glycosylase family 4